MATRLDFTKPHVLRSEDEYEAAVAEIDGLLDHEARPGSEDDDRLRFLTLLVEAYEEEQYPMAGATTPRSVVDFMLEQRGMERSELAAMLGGTDALETFFRGERDLTLPEIRALRDLLGIPADLLL